MDRPTYVLRPETAADQALLLAIYAATREDLERVNCNEDQKCALLHMQFTARQRQFRERHSAANASIIMVDGEPIGRFVVNRSEAAFVLVDIALFPTHRNLGIGRALIEDLLREAAGAGKRVRLRVLADSRAVRLYERIGFSRCREEGAYLDMEWAGPRCLSENNGPSPDA